MNNKLSQKNIDLQSINGCIGSRIYFFEELQSTFEKIKQYPHTNGLTVVCSSQTAGCGRMGRSWESNSGGVYFTFGLTPPFNGFDIPFITILCALGVRDALCRYIDCQIKWPNDIVHRGKKLCGILTKNLVSDGEIKFVSVGIGINVNNTFSDNLPHAVSLSSVTGKEYNENLILADVLNSIDALYSDCSQNEILTRYKECCINIGKEVTFVTGNESFRGVCKDILPDGTMNVSRNGKIINVHSGEVSVKGIYE